MTSNQRHSRVAYSHIATNTQTGQTRTQIVDLTHSLEEGMQIYPGDPIFACRPALTIAADGCSVQQLGLGTHTGTHIDAPSHFFEDGVTIDAVGLESLVARPAVVVDLRDKFRLHPADVGTDLDHQPSKPKTRSRRIIEWEDLQPYEVEIKRHYEGDVGKGCLILLCTSWDKYWNTPVYVQHPYLSEHAANKLLKCGVRVLGVDFLSPDETPSATPINGATDSEIGPERHKPEEDVGAGGAELELTVTSNSETHDSFAVHKVILGSGGLIVENLRGLEALLGKEVQVTIAPMKITGGDGAPARVWATIMNHH